MSFIKIIAWRDSTVNRELVLYKAKPSLILGTLMAPFPHQELFLNAEQRISLSTTRYGLIEAKQKLQTDSM